MTAAHDAGWIPLPVDTAPRAGAVVAVAVGAVRLALWRSDDGAVQAWEDRCPHRGAPLSAGRVRDGQLVCGRHGWRFDVAGRRVAPAEAARAVTDLAACARVYETRAADGRLWVRLAPAPRPEGGAPCR